MMRKVLFLLLISMLAGNPEIWAQRGETEGKFITSLYKEGIVIDGDLKDWDLSAPIVVSRETSWWRNGFVKNDADLKGEVYSNFDRDTLYLAIKVSDNMVDAPYEGTAIYQGDGVELWFDTRLDSDTINMMAQEDDYQIVISPTTKNRKPFQPGIQVFRNDMDVPIYAAAKVVCKPTDNGYVIELALPVESMRGLTTRPGSAMGFNISLCDSDNGSGYSRLLWSGKTEGNPREFGILTFGRLSAEALKAVAEKAKAVRSGRPAKVTAQTPKAGTKEYSGPPRFVKITRNSETVGRFEKFELTVDLQAVYKNPYNFEDLLLQAEFTGPSGKKTVVDGFYFQDYRLNIGYTNNDGQEEVGEPTWKVRFTPTELGKYTYVVTVTDKQKRIAKTDPATFASMASDCQGFLRVSKSDPHYFEFDTGKPFFGIGYGAHLWATTPIDITLHKHFLSQLAAFGGNYLSVNFQTLAESPFDLETNYPKPVLGDRYSLRNAFKVDYLLEAARKRGVYVIPCLNQTASAHSAHWTYNRFNMAQGGPCKGPEEYFTNREAIRLQKQRLRYTVARWGYSPNLLGWELFNEVNYCDAFQKKIETVRTWHRLMAKYLNEIDPNRHPVSTSFGSGDGCEDPEIWKMPEIGFTITHEYTTDPSSVRFRQWRKTTYNKPNLGGEFGQNYPEVNDAQSFDRAGVFFHNALWTCAMSHSAGNILFWWSNQYHDSLDLYDHFRPFKKFIDDIPWTTAGFKEVDLLAMTKAKEAQYSDMVIGSNIYWGRDPTKVYLIDKGLIWAINRDIETKTIDPRQVEAINRSIIKTVPGMLFGANHKEFRKDLVLNINSPRETRMEIRLGAVEKSGTRLLFEMNGTKIKEIEVKDRDGKNYPYAKELGETVTLSLKGGKNRLRVSNQGAGWVALDGVTLKDFAGSTRAEDAVVFGLQGKNLSILWFHNAKNTWYLRWKDPTPLRVVKDIAVTMPGVQDGDYTVEWWDTYTGKIFKEEPITAKGGELTILSPPFDKDVACKIRRK